MSRKKMYFSSAKAARELGLRAAAGARGDRRRHRLVRGQRVSDVTALATEARVRAAATRRDAVGQRARRREFPGRIVADPPRSAAACPCLLPLRAQRRRHRRQPDIWRPTTRCAGSTAWREILDGALGRRLARPRPRCGESLAETGVTAQHCHDVLRAFRLDATKLRYRDWDDLMEYCRYSASPVGRQLLDLHGESRDDLAGLRRAVLGAAGAQPSAGLRRRLPRARPRLPAADDLDAARPGSGSRR